jgi:hypothetical protein
VVSFLLAFSIIYYMHSFSGIHEFMLIYDAFQKLKNLCTPEDDQRKGSKHVIIPPTDKNKC